MIRSFIVSNIFLSQVVNLLCSRSISRVSASMTRYYVRLASRYDFRTLQERVCSRRTFPSVPLDGFFCVAYITEALRLEQNSHRRSHQPEQRHGAFIDGVRKSTLDIS